MGSYEDNLEHIAEPASPAERREAEGIELPDYVALWFTTQLREYAYYHGEENLSDIAVGMASYIDKKVRDEGTSHVTLYIHTDEANQTLDEAATYAIESVDEPDIVGWIRRKVYNNDE